MALILVPDRIDDFDYQRHDEQADLNARGSQSLAFHVIIPGAQPAVLLRGPAGC